MVKSHNWTNRENFEGSEFMNEMEILIYLAVFDDETETPPSTLTNLSSSPYI